MPIQADPPAPTGRSGESPPFRETWFSPPQVFAVHREDHVLLRAPDRLMPGEQNIVAMLVRAARAWPDRPFLSERGTDGEWRTLTFARFAEAVARCALPSFNGARVGLLARNSLNTAIATFAVMARGGTVVPLAPAYLDHPDGLSIPGALAAKVRVELMLVDDDLIDRVQPSAPWPGDRLRPLSSIEPKDLPGPIDLAASALLIAPGDPAKILFTSGSTGTPKAVVQTHAMLCASAAMIEQISPAPLDGKPYTQVDWLPWHHVYGGNVNLHGALSDGGHLYIDGGSPTPEGFGLTLRNLAEVGPHVISTVPAAFPPLLDAMERSPELAGAILRNLAGCAFGGAPLAPALAERFQRLAVAVTGRRIMFGSGYGMTETAGIIAMVYWPTERGDLLGLPVPGVEMKLVPLDDGRYECRVRGPNVFGGYEGDDVEVFDDGGYFRTGDAVRPANPDNWEDGLIYAGRLSEDFKLANGVWVRAGALRADLQAHLGADCLDALIVGSGRDEVGVLILTRPGSPLRGPALIEAISRFNSNRAGASRRIGRAGVLASPPNPDLGEVSAKGSLNPARMTQTRAGEIEALYDEPAASLVSREAEPVV